MKKKVLITILVLVVVLLAFFLSTRVIGRRRQYVGKGTYYLDPGALILGKKVKGKDQTFYKDGTITYKRGFITLKRKVKVLDEKADIKIKTKDEYCGKYFPDYESKENVKVKVNDEKAVYYYEKGGVFYSEMREIKKLQNEPLIELKGNLNFTLVEGIDFKEPGVVAKDKCGNLLEVRTNSNFKKVPGDYEVIYEAEVYGKAVTKKRKIKVVKKSTGSSSGATVVDQGSGGKVYLTFDDGPSFYTRKFLDILDKYNVKATFFVTGNGEDSVIKEIANRGHFIGLHSYSHNYSYVYSSLDNYKADLKKLDERVYRLTGVHSKLVRLPGGTSNTISRRYSKGIVGKIVNYLDSEGYQITDWNISSGDAGATKNPDKILKNVVNHVKHDKLNIVLMHDSHLHTLNSLENIVRTLSNNGFEMLPMTDEGPVIVHRINN